jgi:sulfhydrogenase subunit beta (sulfur reductase)
VVIERGALSELLAGISGNGYQVVGPTVHNGAIVYREVQSASDLPIGWGDEQDGGRYRLKRREDEAVFGYAVGPQSWKQFLFPPRLRLWHARRGENGDGLAFVEETVDTPRYAFFGVRSCELHAIAIQDRVFMPAAHPDRSYEARREDVLLVAVNCGDPAGTCFCSSMGTGPKANSGFDLALTEVLKDGRHRFVIEVGTERGARVLADVPYRSAEDVDWSDAAEVTAGGADGTPYAGGRPEGAPVCQLRAPPVGRGRQSLLDVRKLHDGVPDVLLQLG